MDSVLGENKIVDDETSLSLSSDFKLVPWLRWEEWDSVREGLFSSSTEAVASAISRVSTWRSRGCLPVIVDVTAAILEIRLKDPYYRRDQPADALHSDQLLAMLYCMANLRLVNCVVEKMRKRAEMSIAEAANIIGIPRKLIDVRHEASHRDLPALHVVRDCSEKALDWLKNYYWEPQKQQIPFQGDKIADIRREIKSRLHELAICLKAEQRPQHSASSLKAKGSKKKKSKCLKILMQLYASYSSEATSVLLELLLNALDSSTLEFSNVNVLQSMNTILDDLKSVITRFSKKEPEVLLSLLHTVLDKIENEKERKYETGGLNQVSLEYRLSTPQLELLSSLFAWLVGLLGKLKVLRSTDSTNEVKVSSTGKKFENAALIEVLRRSLFVSVTHNKLLMESSLQLVQLMGKTTLSEKLNKLSSIYSLNLDVTEENTSAMISKNLTRQVDSSIHEAMRKLESIKHERMKNKSKTLNNSGGDIGGSNKWGVAKSWNPCPIGMLPWDVGSSGRLPVLDYAEDKQVVLEPSEKNDMQKLKQYSGKREANCETEASLENSIVKKMKGTSVVSPEGTAEGGYLMIDGVWRKVGQQEIQDIEAAVRILI